MASEAGAEAHTEPTLVSSASTQPSEPVTVQAPTAAILGKQITSGSVAGSQNQSQSSAKSTQSALSERRRKKKEAENAPRPWPDDRKYNPRSLFLFTLQNPIRRAAIHAIEWRGFWDKKVLVIIMLNTATLAMFDCFDLDSMRGCAPEDVDMPPGPFYYCNKMGTGKPFPQYMGRDLQDIIGKIFSAYFTVEFCVKVLALGFIVGPHTFLSESFNWLDLIVVFFGFFDFIPPTPGEEGGGSTSALRALRVLRPLKAVNKFPKLKNLVVLLGQCVSKLVTVVGICGFIFLVFGILGVQLYKGALRGRCFNIETGEVGEDICTLGPVEWSNFDYYWVKKDMEVTGGGHAGGAFRCAPMEEFCMQLGENSGRDTVGFDSIGPAVMSIFQVMTLEGWADLCYEIQDAVGYWNWIYFVLLIMIGPMFAMQLFLVVIATRHSELEAENKEAALKEEEMAPEEAPPEAEGNNKVAPEPQPGDDEDSENGGSSIERKLSSSKIAKKQLSPIQEFRRRMKIFANSELLQNVVMAVILISTVFMACEGLCEFDPDDCSIAEGCLFAGQGCARFKGALEFINLVFTIIFVFELVVKVVGLGPKKFCTGPGSGMNLFDAAIVASSVIEFSGGVDAGRCFFDYFQGAPTETIATSWPTTTDKLGRYVTVKDMFGADGVLGISGIHPMEMAPAWKETLWSIPRVVALDSETLMYNPTMYNFCSGGGGAAVLRAFRLVRLVKFLRAFPEVTKQFKILADVMGSIFALLVLIFIMIFIFTILGMNILGGSMVGEWPPEDGLLPGQEVYVTIPWDQNGGKPRHGKIHWFDFDEHARAPYKIELEYGGNKGGVGGYDPMVNTSLGGALDEYGFIWAATKDDANVGVAVITDYSPRFHFDNLGVAFLTSFQVFTMANWNDDLYDVMGSTGNAAYSFYFYVNIVVGNWILLNLFIAILIGKFSEQRAAALEENLIVMQQRLLEQLGNLSEEGLAEKIQDLFTSIDLDGSGEIDKFEFNEALISLGVKLKPRELNNLVAQVDEDGSGRISFSEFMAMIKIFLHEAKVAIDNTTLSEEMEKAQQIQNEDMENRPEKEEERLPVSCGCLEQENGFRRACLIMINEDKTKFGGGWVGRIGPEFGNLVLAGILMSTVCLAMFTPYTGEDSKMTEMLDIIDIILNTLFTIELVSKWVGLGWKTFIKSAWNKLDLFIVSTSDLDMTLTYALRGSDIPLSSLRIFRVFRIFRALRPLRIIARNKNVRMLVGTLMSAVKPVSVTLAIAVGILFVLGIFFVQFLGGRIKNCSDSSIYVKPECTGLDEDGAPRSWGPPDVNFDNIWSAWIAMFILSSQDDWPSHMWSAVDGTGPLTAAKQGSNPFASVFFILALLVTSAIVINMFVGVFVDCYYGAMEEVAKDNDDGKALKPKILDSIFDDPADGVKKHIYDVISTTKFDMFIAFFIVANVLSMATESFQPSLGQLAYDAWSNYFFTFIFGWECVFKMYTLTPSRYFVSGWNKFDFFIVTISFAGVVIDNAAGAIDIDPSILRILRIFRIFRILRAFRIFKSLKDLQAIVMALGASATQVMNLLLLLMLLFFIFGVLGVNIGGHMCVDGDNEPPADALEQYPLLGVRCAITGEGALLERHGHFQGVGVALLTLWRVATSDAWGDIMNAVSLTPGDRVISSDLAESFLIATGQPVGFLNTHLQNCKSSEYKKFENCTLLDEAMLSEGFEGEHLHSMAVAVQALSNYNASIYEGEADDSWLQLASIALPDCLQEDEANFLSVVGLMDCSNIGTGFSSGTKMCPGTCGFNLAGLFYSQMVAKLYFLLFVCISQFVLLQLVIAVLMDQLTKEQDDGAAGRTNAPGCETLTVAVLCRLYRRMHFNARRKLHLRQKKARAQAKAAQKEAAISGTQDRPTTSEPYASNSS